jgi:hypothetical protein
VDFSEARDLFGIIFQTSGPNCKIMDCGLISENVRGLSAKSAKDLDRGLITKKHGGLFAKWWGISAGDLFFNGKSIDPVHGSWTSSGVISPRFRRGLHSDRRQGLARARPSGRPGLWKLTATAWEGRGAHQGSV